LTEKTVAWKYPRFAIGKGMLARLPDEKRDWFLSSPGEWERAAWDGLKPFSGRLFADKVSM